MHLHTCTCLLIDMAKAININPNPHGVFGDLCNRGQSYYTSVIQWDLDSTGVFKPNSSCNISILVAVVREPLIT